MGGGGGGQDKVAGEREVRGGRLVRHTRSGATQSSWPSLDPAVPARAVDETRAKRGLRGNSLWRAMSGGGTSMIDISPGPEKPAVGAVSGLSEEEGDRTEA